MLFSFEIGSFNPFTQQTFTIIKTLLIIQSIFLAGASYFKKIPIFFTSLYVFIFVLVMSLVIGLFSYYFITELGNEIGLKFSNVFDFSSGHMHEITIDELWSGKILTMFFAYLLAPLFWTITYFNVKEKEI